MVRGHPVLAFLFTLGLVLPAGCGRPVVPGQQFKGKQAYTSSLTPVTSPLPKKHFFEEGPKDAKVRVIAYYPIDAEHQQLMDLLKGFVKQYPGKVYAKYIDYRTPEGERAFVNAKMSVPGILINTRSTFTIQAKPHPYEVDFIQDMGRFWTADDLRRAMAQEIAAVYGKAATTGR